MIEGRSKVLVSSLLDIMEENSGDVTIQVVRRPLHGAVESSGRVVTRFPLKLAAKQFVYYAHDGSETLHVRFFCLKIIEKQLHFSLVLGI